MAEAHDPEPANYPDFNTFFTRALSEGARTMTPDQDAILCPADGSISQIGQIENGRIFQAKGQYYTPRELLADDALADQFSAGKFATIYLSPKDYHRVHMPIDGTLRKMIYVPGELFSVNQVTAENVPRLFARNERAVCLFDTPAGPMVMVLVGAMIVAGIETVWAGQVAPLKKTIRRIDYQQQPEPVTLKKGVEMGRFKLGSTVILLFQHNAIDWISDFEAGSMTRLREALGKSK